MLCNRAAADADTVAEALGQRAPAGASHPGVLVGVAVRVARGELEQRLAGMLASQPFRERDLVGRIRRHDLPAVHGGDDPGRVIHALTPAISPARRKEATSSTCALVSSGNIGSDSTSSATCSDTGKSPRLYPRSRYAG